MNAFHPAVHGILEAALTEHQQAANLARLAGGPAAEDTVARLDDIAEGLSRMIGIITPDLYECAPIDGIEKSWRSYTVMGRLLSQLADYNLPSWENRHGNLVFSLHEAYGGSRAAFRDIADRLGIAYESRPFGSTPGTDHVSARGVIDGLDVEIYALLPTEKCASHDLALVDDVCEQCENPGVDMAPATVQDEDQPSEARGHDQDDELADWERELLARTDTEDLTAEERETRAAAWAEEAAAEQERQDAEDDEDDLLAAALGLDDDEPVSHAPKPDSLAPRCNADEDDPVYSNRPTCPTCRSLVRAQRRSTTTPAPTGDPS